MTGGYLWALACFIMIGAYMVLLNVSGNLGDYIAAALTIAALETARASGRSEGRDD